MACEVNNKEINSQCAELLVRPKYLIGPYLIGLNLGGLNSGRNGF